MLSRIFNKSALWLGRAIVGVLLLSVVGLFIRFFYVAFSDPTIDAVHQRASIAEDVLIIIALKVGTEERCGTLAVFTAPPLIT